MTRYNCHCVVAPRCVHRCTRRQRGSSRRRCNFHVEIRRNDGVDNETMTILVYGPHSGHVLGSRLDVYHLPAHPDVISCCKHDVSDVGCARHVAQMSKCKEAYYTRPRLVH